MEGRTPFGKIFFATFLQLVAVVLLFWLAFPATFAEETSQPGLIVLWTFVLGIPLSLFEYLYHRYLLHSAVLPFLRAMHRSHSHHHGLTSVKAPVTPHEPDLLVPVANKYPVEHEDQEEDMMFPYYAVSIFYALFLPLLGLPLEMIFPGQPIILSTIIAVTVYYTWYEVWHGIMHLPYDRFWKPLMEHARVGRTVRYVYGFHLMHHWRPVANLAVVGFWGFALWDHLFRTHHRPARIPLAGAEVSYVDVDMVKPRWPVATLDRWQAALFKWSRNVESWAARVFLRRADSNKG